MNTDDELDKMEWWNKTPQELARHIVQFEFGNPSNHMTGGRLFRGWSVERTLSCKPLR